MFREGCGLQTAGDLRGRVGGHELSQRPALPQAVGRVPAPTAPRSLPQMQHARSGSPFQTGLRGRLISRSGASMAPPPPDFWALPGTPSHRVGSCFKKEHVSTSPSRSFQKESWLNLY